MTRFLSLLGKTISFATLASGLFLHIAPAQGACEISQGFEAFRTPVIHTVLPVGWKSEFNAGTRSIESFSPDSKCVIRMMWGPAPESGDVSSDAQFYLQQWRKQQQQMEVVSGSDQLTLAGTQALRHSVVSQDGTIQGDMIFFRSTGNKFVVVLLASADAFHGLMLRYPTILRSIQVGLEQSKTPEAAKDPAGQPSGASQDSFKALRELTSHDHLNFPGQEPTPARARETASSGCPAVSIRGTWRGQPYLSGTELGATWGFSALVGLEFRPDGTYRYQVAHGAVDLLRHEGRYTLSVAGAEERRQRYDCVLSLTPNPSSVRVPNKTQYGLLPLRAANLPVDEPVSYRLQPIGSELILQRRQYSPRSVDGTWRLSPER